MNNKIYEQKKKKSAEVNFLYIFLNLTPEYVYRNF